MNVLIEQIADKGILFLSFAWVPLLIWTALALTVLTGLRIFRNIHIQHHYHLRLGLIMALPAGFLLTWFLGTLEPTVAPDGTYSPLKLFVISTPIDLAESDSAFDPNSAFEFLKQFAVWIIAVGTILYAGRYIRQFIRLRYLARSLPMAPINDLISINDQTLKLAESCGRPISIAVVSDSIIPFTFGASKPVIILPAGLMIQKEKLNLVLRHEIMHILNRDYRMHCATAIIRSLFWYNPVVHIIYRQLVEYREIRCDNHVLSDHSISRKKYATLLMELLTPDLNQPLTINMAHANSNLRRRIDMMTSKSIRQLPVKASVTLFSSVLLVTALFMSFTDFRLDDISPPATSMSGSPVDAASFGFLEQPAQLLQSLAMGSSNQSLNSPFRPFQEPVINESQHAEFTSPSTTPGDLSTQRSIEAPAPDGNRFLNEEIDIPEREIAYDPLITTIPLPSSPFHSLLENPVAENSTSRNNDGSESEQLNYSSASDMDYFVAVEQMPELIGGQLQLQSQLTYPDVARRAHVEGTVVIQFIVSEQGQVVQPEIIRSVHNALDREALRVLEQARFLPGRQRGQPVRVRYSVPVIFKLQA